MQKELQIFAEREPGIMSLILGEFWVTMRLYVGEILGDSNISSDSIGCDFFFINLR